MADVRIAEDWKAILSEEFSKPYFDNLVDFVKHEYASGEVFPAGGNIFRAFDKCPLDRLKVVIIGQDPYHGPGQANGLCFSVGEGVPFPPSLRNILQEVSSDVGAPVPLSGELERWAEQGVLLLNAVLTVRAHEAASHAGRGWERFTDAVVKAIAERKQGVVYMLWGSYAQTICLTRTMIGILTYDYDLQLIKRTTVKCTEDISASGIYHTTAILTLNKRDKLLKIGFRELLVEYLLPVFCYAYVCHDNLLLG